MSQVLRKEWLTSSRKGDNAGSKSSLQETLYLTKAKITFGAHWNMVIGRRPCWLCFQGPFVSWTLGSKWDSELHSGRTQPGIHPGRNPTPPFIITLICIWILGIQRIPLGIETCYKYMGHWMLTLAEWCLSPFYISLLGSKIIENHFLVLSQYWNESPHILNHEIRILFY